MLQDIIAPERKDCEAIIIISIDIDINIDDIAIDTAGIDRHLDMAVDVDTDKWIEINKDRDIDRDDRDKYR